MAQPPLESGAWKCRTLRPPSFVAGILAPISKRLLDTLCVPFVDGWISLRQVRHHCLLESFSAPTVGKPVNQKKNVSATSKIQGKLKTMKTYIDPALRSIQNPIDTLSMYSTGSPYISEFLPLSQCHTDLYQKNVWHSGCTTLTRSPGMMQDHLAHHNQNMT